MTNNDFGQLHFITKKMLSDAGAIVETMKPGPVRMLDNFAIKMRLEGFVVHLLANGCNTGGHQSPEHEDGQAIDFTITPKPKIWRVVCGLANDGFKAIGVYLNYKGYYSFHADPCRYRQWFYMIHEDGKRTVLPLLSEKVYGLKYDNRS